MKRNALFTIFVILLSINYIHGASINQRSAQQPAAFVDDSSQHFNGQWGQMEFISEEMKLFAVRGHCRDACARACKPIMLADTDQVFFICPQIKPPEKSIDFLLFLKDFFISAESIAVARSALTLKILKMNKSITKRFNKL
uniref:Uncharacterized protein n=1 Tax=Panagrolaimus davidi TaxID=227884 RepID=A0A914Q7C9_9BILA